MKIEDQNNVSKWNLLMIRMQKKSKIHLNQDRNVSNLIGCIFNDI